MFLQKSSVLYSFLPFCLGGFWLIVYAQMCIVCWFLSYCAVIFWYVGYVRCACFLSVLFLFVICLRLFHMPLFRVYLVLAPIRLCCYFLTRCFPLLLSSFEGGSPVFVAFLVHGALLILSFSACSLCVPISTYFSPVSKNIRKWLL